MIDYDVGSYAGKEYLNKASADTRLCEMIDSGNPFVLGKIGETESRYIFHRKYTPLRFHTKKSDLENLCNNAGFFVSDRKDGKRIYELYGNSLKSIDILAIYRWKYEERIISGFTDDPVCVFNTILSPQFFDEYSWYNTLEGKKVLVIHPFAESIKLQYARRNEIFPGKSYLRNFELETIKAVQTNAGQKDSRFGSWFEALNWMKDQINNSDFDIALLGCGVYGLPLCSHIKNIGKQAIYMGGDLQLLFGIKGKRWDNNSLANILYNESWVRPLPEETPANALRVEEGCYW